MGEKNNNKQRNQKLYFTNIQILEVGGFSTEKNLNSHDFHLVIFSDKPCMVSNNIKIDH